MVVDEAQIAEASSDACAVVGAVGACVALVDGGDAVSGAAMNPSGYALAAVRVAAGCQGWTGGGQGARPCRPMPPGMPVGAARVAAGMLVAAARDASNTVLNICWPVPLASGDAGDPR